jgi:hypothetical protein
MMPTAGEIYIFDALSTQMYSPIHCVLEHKASLETFTEPTILLGCPVSSVLVNLVYVFYSMYVQIITKFTVQ